METSNGRNPARRSGGRRWANHAVSQFCIITISSCCEIMIFLQSSATFALAP